MILRLFNLHHVVLDSDSVLGNEERRTSGFERRWGFCRFGGRGLPPFKRLETIMPTHREQSLIFSYLAMRRLIGILGISLPFIVVIGGFTQGGPNLQGSISGYYYTNMRDCFVGILSGVAFFLISYKGYEKIDDIVANMSGVFALGMIFFPTAMFSGKTVRVGMFLIDDNISEIIHLAFGALFFLALSFNSLFLFTRRHPGVMGREKRRRNVVYRSCGIVMVLAIVCITVYTTALRGTALAAAYPVLILESVALLAFGVSWLVKGNTLFKDNKH